MPFDLSFDDLMLKPGAYRSIYFADMPVEERRSFLISFMETLPDECVDMATFGGYQDNDHGTKLSTINRVGGEDYLRELSTSDHLCGMVACIGGWCHLLWPAASTFHDPVLNPDRLGDGPQLAGMNFLGLTYRQSDALFFGYDANEDFDYWGDVDAMQATHEEVITALKRALL